MADVTREGLSEAFFASFIGDRVEIVADFYQNYSEETAESRITNHAPASIQGYILDLDNEFLYLGKNPHEVSMCLKRDRVLYIEVIGGETKERSPYDELLDSMPVPKKSEEN